jgi:hypothetical protein
MTFCHFSRHPCVHLLLQIKSPVVNLVVDSKEFDRKPLGEGWPKGICPASARLLKV